MATLTKNTIFTNVALTPEGGVWWEGMTDEPPAECSIGAATAGRRRSRRRPAARRRIPTARFTAPARSVPASIPHGSPGGVPIAAFVFGGPPRHDHAAGLPGLQLVAGVYIGATMGSETTAAAAGAIGKVRRDPMAMLPFCGYHMGDYFRHWLKMQRSLAVTPRVFHVNWFRKDEDGKFLWPGFGENMRVLKWIVDRVHGRALARETPIGWTPYYEDMTGRARLLAREL